MPSSATEPKQSKWWTIRWVVAIWLIGWLGMIVATAIENTDMMSGASIGVFIGGFISPFALILTLPLGALGFGIGGISKLRPYRTLISILSASSIWIGCIGVAIHRRFTPERALQQWTGVLFPPDATLRSHSFFGGGLADDKHTFVFSCSAEETGRLIRELKLAGGPVNDVSYYQQPEIAAEGWKPAERWSKSDLKGSPDYVELITDSTHTKVYLTFGQI